jgi:ribosomal protein S18 acetylase RimI-like enzyme
MAPVTSSLIVRGMSSFDLKAVVSLHISSFPDFFLSSLGPRFLREFYGSFLFCPNGVAFVVEDVGKKQIVGVIAGPVSPDGYFRNLLYRRWWSFCLASLTAVVKNPGIIPRLWRAISYRGEAPLDSPRALLSSIAVAPDFQKMGIGQMLLKAWVNEISLRGAFGCYLITDADNNDAVNGFYLRMGWVRVGAFFTPDGRKMQRYVLDFNQCKSLE